MGWSDLPADLLGCISSHLPVVDFLRLSSVCISWNSALANKDFLRIRRPPSPWLLFPGNIPGEASDTLTFRDLSIEEEDSNCSSHRRFSSLGSHISGRYRIGSKDGWLVTLDKTNLQLRLFNPLTKAEIALPPLFTSPEDGEHRIKPQYAPDIHSLDFYFNERHLSLSRGSERLHNIFVKKIVISSNDPSVTAVVICGYRGIMALARPGDRNWVLNPLVPPSFGFDFHHWEGFEDVYYHEEERMFYAITRYLMVIAFDINGQNATLICPAIPGHIDIYSHVRNYIVFLSGTLIRIRRVIQFIKREPDEMYARKTTEISVFKFVPAIGASSCSSSQWISINDLEGCSLFVGYNHTFSLHHTIAPKIRPNCIYFSDDWVTMSSEGDVDFDVGLFDLHNDCFHYFIDSKSKPGYYWPTSMWFSPSLL